jgi:diguanylate cyclase (GGDEF)-like protein
LTGALNRRAFLEAAERERLRAERRGEPLSVAYLDLDGFKEVNDRHGHQEGDRVLEDLADRVLQTIRGTDLFCRIGGDEFVLLLPDTGAREAAAVLQRARAAMADGGSPVTASVGIATFRIVPTGVAAMVEAADELMYRAKGRGKDRIVGAVLGGPWLRWDTDTREPAADTVTVDVEILAGDGAA